VTVRGADGQVVAERMLDARASRAEVDVAAADSPAQVAERFLALGVRHILGGYDHLLFLAALLLGVTTAAGIVRTVTAFTAAHSLTLTLATLELVRAPAAVVEPLIAASIVFVGVENLVRLPANSRWKLAFAFGLIHGFGFAGALQDLQDLAVAAAGAGVALPLASFNAGVEVGQIAVALLLWPVARGLRAETARRWHIAPACSVLVVIAGTYWLLQRTLT
jgi:hydrogenase/urease accessory protein HupE